MQVDVSLFPQLYKSNIYLNFTKILEEFSNSSQKSSKVLENFLKIAATERNWTIFGDHLICNLRRVCSLFKKKE